MLERRIEIRPTRAGRAAGCRWGRADHGGNLAQTGTVASHARPGPPVARWRRTACPGPRFRDGRFVEDRVASDLAERLLLARKDW